MELASKVAFLARSESYPDASGGVTSVESHRSWVFLTDRHAYKLKKPAHRGHLDFSTLEARGLACREEVRLNRRLAPEVYLGVVPLTRGNGGLCLDGEGEVVEWLVKMRRLPEKRMLNQVRGRARPAEIAAVGGLLAGFYRYRAEPAPMLAAAYLERFSVDVEECRGELGPMSDSVAGSLLRYLAARPEELARRAAHVVEGHGDLRPEHVCLEPVAILDCLDFHRPFRLLDPADDLCLLWLECQRVGCDEVGHRILEIALPELPSPQVLDFYRAHHGLLRAKLALWHTPTDPPRWEAVGRDYLARAAASLPLVAR